MNEHQVSQGFAPRSEQTYQYYQIQPSPMSTAKAPAFPSPQPLGSAPRPSPPVSADRLPFPYPTVSQQSTGARPASTSVEGQARSLLQSSSQSTAPSTIRGTTTEGGEPLRTLIIPASLLATFVSIAERNTRANVETCGLLMGTIDADMLQVNNLLIPKQTASSDRCDTEDEEGIWNFMESKGLVTLGWCHTHPQQ